MPVLERSSASGAARTQHRTPRAAAVAMLLAGAGAALALAPAAVWAGSQVHFDTPPPFSSSGSADVPSSAAPVTSAGSNATTTAITFDHSTLSLHCAPSTTADWMSTSGASYTRRITPRDCLVVADNAPSFVWLVHPSPASGAVYRLTLLNAVGATVTTLSSSVPYLHLTAPLPAGDYRWRVAITSSAGPDAVSQERRFRIGAEAWPLSLPSPSTALATARGKAHPRLLPEAAEWQAAVSSATRASGSRHALYSSWLSAAQGLVGATLPADPAVHTLASLGNADALNLHHNDVAHTATTLGQSVTRLALLAQVSGNTALRGEAVRRLRHLASWDPQGMSSEAQQDQANREVFYALASGYDLLWDQLSAADRTLIETRVAQRVQQQYDGAFATLRTGRLPYDSHGVTGAGFAAAATLLMAGSSPAFDAMATEYFRWFVPNMLVWGEQDGSDGNGHAYGWFNLVTLQPALVVMANVASAPVAQRAVVRNSPLWQAMFTPPPSMAGAQSNMGITLFGDGSDWRYAYMHEFHATVSRFFAAVLPAGVGRDVAAWLWGRHPTQSTATLQEPLWLLSAPEDSVTVKPTALPDAAVFPDAGLVAMHSDVASPTRSSLYFRASRFGSYNHSMADNGAFVFSAGGLPLLVNSGYYDYYGSAHHTRYARHTKAKNALTVDGGLGQALDETTGRKTVAHTMAAPAQLLGFRVDGDRAGASADLTAAYRTVRWDVPHTALLDRYQRSVAYDKARRMAFVLDRAGSSATPRTFELNFHSVGVWTPTSDGGLRTANAAAQVCLNVVTRDAAVLTRQQSSQFLDLDGVEVLPTRSHREHAHLTLATPTRVTTFDALTIVREDCTAPLPDVSWAADGHTVRVAYRTGGGFALGAAGFAP